jgi:hypothetical protein
MGAGCVMANGPSAAKSALDLGDSRLPQPRHFQSGALFAVRDSGWDHALKVTASGKGAVVRVSGDRPLVITAPGGGTYTGGLTVDGHANDKGRLSFAELTAGGALAYRTDPGHRLGRRDRPRRRRRTAPGMMVSTGPFA